MHTWRPNKQQSQEDISSLIAKVRASLLESTQQFNLKDKIQSFLPKDEEMLKIIHPIFFEWYFEFLQSVDGRNTNKICSNITQLDKVFQNIYASESRAATNEKLIFASVDITNKDDTSLNTLERAMQTAEEIHGCNLKINLLQDFSESQLESVKNSFILLKKIWFEAYEEIQDFVQRIQFFDAERVIGFVDFQNHGSIFLRKDDMVDKVWLAEQILHEESHVRLNTTLAVTPLFLNNGDALYDSPLRLEPRPMFGLFHQMFVLSRLFYFYVRLSNTTDRYQKKLELIENQFKQATDVVSRHAILTEEGQKLVNTINQLLA
jgi:hypothetical protein